MWVTVSAHIPHCITYILKALWEGDYVYLMDHYLSSTGHDHVRGGVLKECIPTKQWRIRNTLKVQQ